MSPKNFFFLSQNATSAPTAVEDIKQYLGDDAGLVVVPYFKLPANFERFDDTEGRFPQLKELEEIIRDSDDAGSTYWFAQVLPEKEGGEIQYLALYTVGGLKLYQQFPHISTRYIGTLVVQD